MKINLGQLKRIHVQFNALDPRSVSVREFLARATAPKALETQGATKIDISHKIRIDEQPPVVVVNFVNGVEKVINCKDKSCEDIINEIQSTSSQLDLVTLLDSAGLKGIKLHKTAADSQKRKAAK